MLASFTNYWSTHFLPNVILWSFSVVIHYILKKGGESNLTKFFRRKSISSRRFKGRDDPRVKSIAKKKVAQVVAFFMLVSILLPVIAFGAATTLGFQSYSFDKTSGTVTASVYSNVYNNSVFEAVYVNVYRPDGTVLGSVYNHSNDYVNPVPDGNGNYYFTVTGTVPGANVYDAVYLKAEYKGIQSERVYATDAYPDCTSNCGGGGGYHGGGGGGVVTTPPTTGDGSGLDVPENGEVNSDSLKNALAATPNVTLTLTGDTVLIPASALLDAIGKAGSTITIVSGDGTITLPLSAINLNALAQSLGVDVMDLKIQVTIAQVNGDAANAIAVAAQFLGGTKIADAVDFSVIAVGTNGKSTPVDFGNTYISRTINVQKAPDSRKTTGVLFNGTTNKLSFIPTSFSTKDGKNIATMKRPGNSIYTVLEFDKSFNDTASHWSRDDVQLLANKLVVEGVTSTSFEPDRNITRAEFAALVVRSLGLFYSEAPSSESFTDVSSSEWYASVVSAASKVGIIDGYEDGTFRPNAQINREELSAMVIRAMRFAGVSTSVSDSQQTALLNRFMDSGQIVWAKAEIAAAIDAGLINGMTDTTIGSRQQATRAQSATMLKRFLTKAAFID
jgi:N-acetylmuramoyl-L-alanine amidase